MSDVGTKPMGERVQALESWMAEHEKRCGDRYQLLMGVIAVGGSIVISVAAWGLNTVHETQKEQIRLLQHVSAQVATPTP